MFDAATYWDNRYKGGGTSGRGNEGDLLGFKIGTLSNYVSMLEPKNIIDLGCGDGEVVKRAMFSCPYTGVDVSPAAVAKCRKEIGKKIRTYSFFMNDAIGRKFWYTPAGYDVALSLDVIYHLIDQARYDAYMRDLTSLSRSAIIIFSSNFESPVGPAWTRHRRFATWMENHAQRWKLADTIRNPFPERGDGRGSHSDFYLYRKAS